MTEAWYEEMLVTVDPGANTGWAEFVDRELFSCGMQKFDKALSEIKNMSIRKIVVELPRVYPSGRQPVDPNDLITLACRAGRLLESARFATKETVYPSDWKRQVPDEILYSRINKALSVKERKVVESCKCAKSAKHNLLDAIGIGLVALRRVGPGITNASNSQET